MRQFVQKQRLYKRFHFAGALTGADLVNAYHAMDVFAFASKSETQGLVVAEAMAAGVPVVALDAPGVREVIKNGVNGWLLQREDTESFALRLSDIFESDREESAKFICAAKATADQFSLVRCAERLLDLYELTHRARFRRQKKDRSGDWQKLLGRMKAEWELAKNFGKAAGSAIVNKS